MAIIWEGKELVSLGRKGIRLEDKERKKLKRYMEETIRKKIRI